MHAHQGPQWLGIVIPMVIVALILALRLRQVGKARRLRLETLWIVPAIYGVVAAWIFWTLPPHGLAWAGCAAALVVGGLLGWKRGSLMAISVDPQTHALNQTSSRGSMIFILVLMGIRFGSRALAAQMGWTAHGGIMLLTDVLVAFALGLLTVQRIEMFLRARRLLAAARASR